MYCFKKSQCVTIDKGKWVGKERLRWAKSFNVPMAENLPPGFPANTIKVRIQKSPKAKLILPGSEGFDRRGCSSSREIGRHPCCDLSCIIRRAERGPYAGESHAYSGEDFWRRGIEGNPNQGEHRSGLNTGIQVDLISCSQQVTISRSF